jgi:hypothetical protein
VNAIETWPLLVGGPADGQSVSPALIGTQVIRAMVAPAPYWDLDADRDEVVEFASYRMETFAGPALPSLRFYVHERLVAQSAITLLWPRLVERALAGAVR